MPAALKTRLYYLKQRPEQTLICSQHNFYVPITAWHFLERLPLGKECFKQKELKQRELPVFLP